MEEVADLVKKRKEMMVPLFGDTNPVLRTAYFLEPTATSIDEPVAELPSLSPSSLLPPFQPREWQKLKDSFTGWLYPTQDWQSWVDRLRPKYEFVWKEAGIHEAILSSTYRILRDRELIFLLTEKWCPETNTFIFPWGEVTVTLEDVMILGGYSVLGDSVFSSDEAVNEIEKKLREERLEIQRGPEKKATQTKWIKKFMGSENEIEHEAFLSLWLARFVFPESDKVLKTSAPFRIAAHLARGHHVALAPAVLAWIYRDLSRLKETITGSSKISIDEKDDDRVVRQRLGLFSPLVQLWAWERFRELQPKPNVINNGEPRAARWDKIKCLKHQNLRLALDSAAGSFHWRPYDSKFYEEEGKWVSVEPGIDDEELLSYALCLRVTQLVGPGCIKQYLPHRVAMQFGIDQDLPVHVARYNDTPEIAWSNYTRPFGAQKLYIPPRFSKTDVTVRYAEWWKESVLVQPDMTRKTSTSILEKIKTFAPPGFAPKYKSDIIYADHNNADVPHGFPPKCEPDINGSDDNLASAQLCDDMSFPSLAQDHSSSIADGGELKKTVLLVPAEKLEPVELDMRRSTKFTNINVIEDGNPSCNAEMVRENSVDGGVDFIFALEARVARLERRVVEIKAARMKHRSQKNQY